MTCSRFRTGSRQSTKDENGKTSFILTLVFNKDYESIKRIFEDAADEFNLSRLVFASTTIKVAKDRRFIPFTVNEVNLILKNKVRHDYRDYFLVRFFTG